MQAVSPARAEEEDIMGPPPPPSARSGEVHQGRYLGGKPDGVMGIVSVGDVLQQEALGR